jgi:hypothetical protein
VSQVIKDAVEVASHRVEHGCIKLGEVLTAAIDRHQLQTSGVEGQLWEIDSTLHRIADALESIASSMASRE